VELLLLLIAQTVPYEYPYFEVVRREVRFIPMPGGIDSTTYERRLRLECEEASLTSIVTGFIQERWLDSGNPAALQEILHCDSIVRRADTLIAYSSLRFVLTRLDAGIRLIDLIVGLRYADREDINHTVDEILERLGFGGKPCRLLADAGSLVSLELRPKGGVILVNLSTGAVVSADIVQPQAQKHKRSCLFRR